MHPCDVDAGGYAKNEAEDLAQAQIKRLGEAAWKKFHDE
jgi:hypothetical protein